MACTQKQSLHTSHRSSCDRSSVATREADESAGKDRQLPLFPSGEMLRHLATSAVTVALCIVTYKVYKRVKSSGKKSKAGGRRSRYGPNPFMELLCKIYTCFRYVALFTSLHFRSKSAHRVIDSSLRTEVGCRFPVFERSRPGCFQGLLCIYFIPIIPN